MGATLEFWAIPASVADGLTHTVNTRSIQALIDMIRAGEQIGSLTVNAVVADDFAQRLIEAGFADWPQSPLLLPELAERPTRGVRLLSRRFL